MEIRTGGAQPGVGAESVAKPVTERQAAAVPQAPADGGQATQVQDAMVRAQDMGVFARQGADAGPSPGAPPADPGLAEEAVQRRLTESMRSMGGLARPATSGAAGGESARPDHLSAERPDADWSSLRADVEGRHAHIAPDQGVLVNLGGTVDGIAGGIRELVATGEKLVDDARDAAARLREDRPKQIESKLRELNSDGDKITIACGGSAAGLGIKVGQKAEATVEMKGKPPDAKYVVTMGGEAAAGLAKTGKGVSAEATAGGGVKVEYTFNSPEEAARGIALMERRAAADAMANISARPPDDGLSADDRAFLSKNMSAVEIKGAAAAQIAADLGVGVNLGGKVDAKGELAVRIEPGRDGKPGKVTVSTDLTGGVTGGVKAGGEAAKVGMAEAETKGCVKLETTFSLPADADPRRLVNDPAGLVRHVRTEMKKTPETTVTFKLSSSARAMGSGEGVETEIKMKLDAKGTERLLRGKAIPSVLDGDLRGALREVGDNVEVEAKIDRIRYRGIKSSVDVDAGVAGGSYELEYSTADREPLVKPFSGKAGQIGGRIEQLPPYVDA